ATLQVCSTLWRSSLLCSWRASREVRLFWTAAMSFWTAASRLRISPICSSALSSSCFLLSLLPFSFSRDCICSPLTCIWFASAALRFSSSFSSSSTVFFHLFTFSAQRITIRQSCTVSLERSYSSRLTMRFFWFSNSSFFLSRSCVACSSRSSY
ncbi:unnamed protein product, partial [Ixodes hexagonus]